MTGRVIGTTGGITARREECVEFISQFAKQQFVDAKAISRLRGVLGSELAALVVSVAALQPKARRKFGPGVWWVTEKSLQQATPWQVAKLKSTWLGDRAAYDLCCGVGGDTVQLAGRGSVVAVDWDTTLVEMAAANLVQADVDLDRVQTICSDATTIEIPARAVVHIDPDRRAGQHPHGGRSSQPDQYRPAWSDVLRIIAHVDGAVVKLAPAANIDLADIAGTHRCWISLGGTVREQSLLCGSATESSGLQPGVRSAVALTSDGSACWFVPGNKNDLEESGADVRARPMGVLIDPDAAIRAAGLTEAFARQHALTILGSPSGYLTSDASPLAKSASTMAVVGDVIWSGSCDDRKLRKELRSRDVYPSVIKVRGTDHNPAVLSKRYRKCGDQPVTLWIGRTSEGVFAAITQPLDR